MTGEEEDATKKTLRTLIVWMAQSANSPIRMAEAKDLLRMLDGIPDIEPDIEPDTDGGK